MTSASKIETELATQIANAQTASAYLLQRSASPEHLSAQAARLAEPLSQAAASPTASSTASQSRSVLVFRLGREWFALPASRCQQVLIPVSAHTLPHRTNATLLGVVNVQGQMLLKVSLRAILDYQSGVSQAVSSQAVSSQPVSSQPGVSQPGPKVYSRMVVIERTVADEPETWVFDVDELEGIQTVLDHRLEAVAAGVTASNSACTHRVFVWAEQRVSLLDDDQLFEALRQRAL
ncbi:MAG: chemotaxis protein CheW [Cyanobacteria bacterium J06627_28]